MIVASHNVGGPRSTVKYIYLAVAGALAGYCLCPEHFQKLSQLGKTLVMIGINCHDQLISLAR